MSINENQSSKDRSFYKILRTIYKTNSIPYHVIIKPDGTEVKLGLTFDSDEFREFEK